MSGAGAGALGVSGSGAEGAPRASRGPALPQLQDWCIGVERPDARPEAALCREGRLVSTSRAPPCKAATQSHHSSAARCRAQRSERSEWSEHGEDGGAVAWPCGAGARGQTEETHAHTPLCPPSLRPRSPSPPHSARAHAPRAAHAHAPAPRRSRTRPRAAPLTLTLPAPLTLTLPAPLTLTRTRTRTAQPSPRSASPTPPLRHRGRGDTRIPNGNGSSAPMQPSSCRANRAVPACGSHPTWGSDPTLYHFRAGPARDGGKY